MAATIPRPNRFFIAANTLVWSPPWPAWWRWAGGRAWSVELLQIKQRIETKDGLILTWEKGQNSALDTSLIADGRDVGNVLVQRKTSDGKLIDALYRVDLAFAFHAFYPNAKIIVE